MSRVTSHLIVRNLKDPSWLGFKVAGLILKCHLNVGTDEVTAASLHVGVSEKSLVHIRMPYVLKEIGVHISSHL